MRAWAFGFGKANREKLPAIMAYSVLQMLCLAEVGAARCPAASPVDPLAAPSRPWQALLNRALV
jgi:hypothetical protein